jgi:hypothetical protein
VCKKKQTGEPRTTSLFQACLQVESQVRICGREPVRFVRNFWKRNTPRRQYTARAADGSGRDNAGHLSGNLKFRGRSLINELDPYWQLQCLMLLAPPGEFSNVALPCAEFPAPHDQGRLPRFRPPNRRSTCPWRIDIVASFECNVTMLHWWKPLNGFSVGTSGLTITRINGLHWPHFGVSQHISERCPTRYQISWLEPEDWFFHSHSSPRWQSESPSI